MSQSQSFLERMAPGLVSSKVYGKIQSGRIIDQFRDIEDRICKATLGESDFHLPIPNPLRADHGLVVNLRELSESVDQGITTLSLPSVSDDGEVTEPISLPVEDIIEAVSAEIDVARLQADVAGVLVEALNGNGDFSITVNTIKSKLQKASTSAGELLRDIESSISVAVGNVKDYAKNFLSVLLSRGSRDKTFSPSSVGEYTNTWGWTLFSDRIGVVLSEWLTNTIGISVRLYNTIDELLGNVDQTAFINAFNAVVGTVSWKISNIFHDEYLSRTSSFDDASCTNGFEDLGEVSHSVLSNALSNFQISSDESAIVIPTLGATWYLFKREGKWHYGGTKHIYSCGCSLEDEHPSIPHLVAIASATGNDWEDLVALSHPELPISMSDRNFWYVKDYNNYVCNSLAYSEQLISLGLLAISGDALSNQWYQDATMVSKMRFRFSRYYQDQDPSPTAWTRSMFIDEATYFGDSASRTFIQRCLGDYIANVNSINTQRYWHFLSEESLTGSSLLQDDATIVQDKKTKVLILGAAAIITAVTVTAIVAKVKLTKAAKTAVVIANRAAADRGVNVTEALKLKKKANFLCKLSGVKAGDMVVAAQESLLPAMEEESIETETKLSDDITVSSQEVINDFRKLITGNSHDIR